MTARRPLKASALFTIRRSGCVPAEPYPPNRTNRVAPSGNLCYAFLNFRHANGGVQTQNKNRFYILASPFCCPAHGERLSAHKTLDGRNIRPDIVVHQRKGGNADNSIIIEAKKGYGNEWDQAKVEGLVDQEDFKYEVGAVISYLPRCNYFRIRLYKGNGVWEGYRLNKAANCRSRPCV